FRDMVYRDRDPARLGKVIVRWQPGAIITAGNHEAEMPRREAVVHTSKAMQVRHFPYRSEEQFVTKVINGSRAYSLTSLPDHIGSHWRDSGRVYDAGGAAALRGLYRRQFHYDLPAADGLVHDPARLD